MAGALAIVCGGRYKYHCSFVSKYLLLHHTSTTTSSSYKIDFLKLQPNHYSKSTSELNRPTTSPATTKMKTTTSLALLASVLSTAQAQYLSLIAARSASPIHLSPITASGQRLWIGRNTVSYCPESVEELDACPPGNTTTFAGGNGSLGMGTVVPGGQQVYIEPACGAVQFTQAHSAAQPQGAIQDGWNYSPGSSFGYLSWKNGLLACPATDGGAGYEVFAAVDGVVFADTCLGFNALASNVSEAGAWQYT